MGLIVDVGQEKEAHNVRHGCEADEPQRLMDRLYFAGSGVDGRIGGAEYFVAEGDIPADECFEFMEGGPGALELCQQFQDHQTVGGTPLPLDNIWAAEKIPLEILESKGFIVGEILLGLDLLRQQLYVICRKSSTCSATVVRPEASTSILIMSASSTSGRRCSW